MSRLLPVLLAALAAAAGCRADPSEAARTSATDEQASTPGSDTDKETNPTSGDIPDDLRMYFLHFDRSGAPFHRQLRHEDSVDVWAVFDREGLERTYRAAGVRGAPGSRYDEPIAIQLLQHVSVMRVDSRHETEGMTVGLSVTLEEARLLDIAQRFGDLSLALRAPEDVEIGPVITRQLDGYAGSLDSLRIQRQRRLEHYSSRADDERPLAERLPKQAESEKENDSELEIVRDGDDDSYRDWERGRALFLPTDLPLEAVSAGDRIDIQATFAGSDPLAGSDNRRDVGHILLQGVEILDVPERESSDGLVVELRDNEIALVLLAVRRGELTANLRPRGDDASESVEARALDESLDELEFVLDGEKESSRDRYKEKFYSDATDDVCADYGNCLERYDLSVTSAPQELALVGPEGDVRETGLLYADSGDYPEAAGRCIRESLQSVTLPPPPELRSVYLRCRPDLTPDITRGDNSGRGHTSNDSSETRAQVYFVTHGHYPPSLGEKFRKVFE